MADCWADLLVHALTTLPANLDSTSAQNGLLSPLISETAERAPVNRSVASRAVLLVEAVITGLDVALLISYELSQYSHSNYQIWSHFIEQHQPIQKDFSCKTDVFGGCAISVRCPSASTDGLPD